MADVFFDNPPTLQGAEAEQLQQLYSYLGIMSGKLNEALMSITIEQLAPETRETIRYAAEVQPAEQGKTLKELIIKTAQIVRTEMEEIRTTLTETINAQSDDFGALTRELRDDIDVNATGIRQIFTFKEEIDSRLDGVEGTTRTWSQYVKVGQIAEGVTGVAIGEDEKIYASFTKDALTFYQGSWESPVAYFSEMKLFITNGEITDSLTIGNHYWKKLNDGGLALIAGSVQSGGGN